MKKLSSTLFVVGLFTGTVLAQEKTADEIARELSNPATPLSTLGNNLEYKSFQGDLPGANSQDSWSYTFQPSFPFPLGDGKIVALRPAIPLLIDQPAFNGTKFEGTDEQLGDISYDLIYGGTSAEGLITLAGVIGTLPTATDDAVGSDTWRLGPNVLIGQVFEWGVLAALVNHQWDLDGDDDESTSITAVNYIYSYSLGDGYQFASGPIITYDWEAESGNEWTVPLGIGLSKTLIYGGTPVKTQVQLFYNIESPDDFGMDWGLKFSLSPVVKNPFIIN